MSEAYCDGPSKVNISVANDTIVQVSPGNMPSSFVFPTTVTTTNGCNFRVRAPVKVFYAGSTSQPTEF